MAIPIMSACADGQAAYREAEVKSLLRNSGWTDPCFLARYGVNLYRGCAHGCLYCDGRAERYYVQGDFARDIVVKRNAPQLLASELGRLREPGFVFLGGGVADAYQPAEARYGLARAALELALAHRLPVHVLTKSALVERDLELLARINVRARAVLSFSIATADDGVRQAFEPGAAPLAERWRLLARAKDLGLGTGVMAMPLLPGLSDQVEHVEALAAHAQRVGVDFLCAGSLTLRPGVQMDTYLARLRELRPDLLAGYDKLYRAMRPSGVGSAGYLSRVERAAGAPAAKGRLPARRSRAAEHDRRAAPTQILACSDDVAFAVEELHASVMARRKGEESHA